MNINVTLYLSCDVSAVSNVFKNYPFSPFLSSRKLSVRLELKLFWYI